MKIFGYCYDTRNDYHTVEYGISCGVVIAGSLDEAKAMVIEHPDTEDSYVWVEIPFEEGHKEIGSYFE